MSIVTDELLKEVESVFHQPPEMYNCAQSVVALCGHSDLCAECKAYGGGRAPGGLCGALYGALMLVPESKRVAAMQAFIKEAGAAECHDIKANTGTPCQKCIAIGTALAREEMEK